MHGDFDQARIEFQRAILADAGDPIPRVFLGNLALGTATFSSPSRCTTTRSRRSP
jgi:hypothetical protein